MGRRAFAESFTRASLTTPTIGAVIYHSIAQDAIDVESLDVRTFADPSRLISQVRQAVRSVRPESADRRHRQLAEQVSSNLAQQRLIARLTTIFGVLALVWLALAFME